MPSTTSSSLCRVFDSSTVITPSLPTFSIASAIMSPIVESPLAEIVPTWAMSFLPLVGVDIAFRSSMIEATEASMPRLRSIGFRPAATSLAPSL
jgi:hypothetical protein